jgi:hypothetical protein
VTSIVGVFCKDGVVIGTDSSATFSTGNIATIEQPYEKIRIISNRVIVAGTGQIGLGQRFNNVVQKSHDLKVFDKNSALDVARILARESIKDFAETHVDRNQYGALVAFPTGSKCNLCEFAIKDFQPEMKNEKLWFVSMGSGQLITDPFLAFIREVFWSNGVPTVNEAVFSVTWTLDHAVAYNAGGINGPVKIAVLENISGKLRARILEEEELFEHRDNINECKETLRSMRDKHQPEHESTPAIPTANLEN